MKSIVNHTVALAVGLLLSTSFLAQGKAKVHIKKNVNGVTSEQTLELNIAEGEDIQKILQEVGVLDEFGQLKPGEEFEIKIDKYDNNNNAENLHFFFSPDLMEPHMPADAPIQNFSYMFEKKRPFLGVILRDNIPGEHGKEKKTGAYVTEVIEGSAAEKAGIRTGDIIVAIDKKKMADMNDVIEYVRSKEAGDKVDVQVLRDGKKKKMKAVLGEKESESPMMFELNAPLDMRGFKGLDMLRNFNFRFEADSITIFCPSTPNCICPNDSMKICQPFSWNSNGMAVRETAFLGVTPWYAPELKEGVKVYVEEETSAQEMGLENGDIIKSFNGVSVNNFDMLADEIRKVAPGSEVTLLIERDGRERQIKGNIGKRSMSGFEDFRIFHDFKGMDEGGNYTYDYEFDMDAEDVQEHMEELLRALDEQQQMLDGERRRILEEMERMDTRKESIVIKIRIDEISEEELAAVNENASPKLSASNDLALDEISFFPNPGEGLINLSFTTKDKNDVSIVIYNAEGETVYRELRTDFEGSYSNTIDISGQPNGTYYLQIMQGNKSYSKKLVKGL